MRVLASLNLAAPAGLLGAERINQRSEAIEMRPPGAEEAAADVTRDTKAFTVAMRNCIFTFLRGLVNSDFDQAITHLSLPEDPGDQPWTTARLQQALDAYHAEHERICLDPNARNIRHTYVLPAEDKRAWRV